MIEGKEIYYGLKDINWKRPTQVIRVLGSYIILTLGGALFLLPLLWMVTTALKTETELYIFPPTFIPKTWMWSNFPDGWNYSNMDFSRWLVNTIYITAVVMVGTLLSSSLCAYGFSRIKFPGRDFWFMCVLASIMLPGVVTLIPLYIMYFKIGWLDTFKPLTIPAFFGGGAFAIFMLRQFFMSIPMELEEAAILDGASRLRIWFTIFLPLSKPALAVIAVLSFQGVWNDFYGPLIFLSNPENFTLALGINLFKGLYNVKTNLMMAMSFLMVIPMIIIFFIAQKQMIRGVILSGLKA